MSYRIRPYRPGDREPVARLLTRLWPVDPALSERFLVWRYERNPFDQALRWGEFREVRIWWNRFPRRVSNVLSEHGFRAAPDEARRKSTHLVANTRRGDGDFMVNGVDALDLANWDPRMIHSDAT